MPKKIEIFVFKYFYDKLQTVKEMSSSINYASAQDKLQNIAAIISKGECTSIRHMKSLIRELTIAINSLTNGEKIEFIEMFNICFKSYYSTFPEAMELYFTQIITIIDANLSLIIDFTDIEFMQLAKLSNDTMRMIVTEFEK